MEENGGVGRPAPNEGRGRETCDERELKKGERRMTSIRNSEFEIQNSPDDFEFAVRYWDTASSVDRGDYTAGVLMAKKGKTYTVLDVCRGRWSPHRRNQRIVQQAKLDRSRLTCRYEIWIEQEPGSGGLESALTSRDELAGFAVHTKVATGSKDLRAAPFAAWAEAGHVQVAQGSWLEAFLDELCVFPFGRHDDQVDAASGAFHVLTLQREMTYRRPIGRRF